MDHKMFCFQCEQTAGCTGCTGKAGVCGKTADVAKLQDELTGALIGLARVTDGDAPVNADTWRLMIEGLFTTVTNVSFNEKTIRELIDRVHEEKARLVPGCSGCGSRCGSNDDYDMNLLWNAQEDIRSLKSLILFGVRGMAAYAHHAMMLGYADEEVNRFFAKALFAVGEDWGMDELLPIVMEVGEKNLKCMALLDKANTESYGTPASATVPLTVEKGPFIVITGHDLHDLKLLLEQTEGKGVNIYTHGEMLPAHGYPELRKFKHLVGNYGSGWQNQQVEFARFPGPIVMTSNCIIDPTVGAYDDRIWTRSIVGWPGVRHLDGDDFSAVITQAQQMAGFPYSEIPHLITVGFGRQTLLGAADTLIDLVSREKLRHIFLLGGCDGARGERHYFTDFATSVPDDCLILTLACGKYRFNKLEFGDIEGLPRLVDAGQCNDAYSAIILAVTLAEKLGCGVNDLPLSLVLSWFEQKAIVILLTLLSLGVKNIVTGPTAPGFLTPDLLAVLNEKFGLRSITTVEEDMKQLLSA